MNSLNTQDKTIVSSNLSTLSCLTEEEKKLLKKADYEELQDEGIEDGVNMINYFDENQIDDTIADQLINRIETLKQMPNNALSHIINLGEQLVTTNQSNFDKSTDFLDYIQNQGLEEDPEFVSQIASELDSLKTEGVLIHIVNLGKMVLEQGVDITFQNNSTMSEM